MEFSVEGRVRNESEEFLYCPRYLDVTFVNHIRDVSDSEL